MGRGITCEKRDPSPRNFQKKFEWTAIRVTLQPHMKRQLQDRRFGRRKPLVKSARTPARPQMMDLFVSNELKDIELHAAAVKAMIPVPVPEQPRAEKPFSTRKLDGRKPSMMARWRAVPAMILLNLMVLEGGSWAAYWMLTGEPFTFASARAEQSDIAATGETERAKLAGSGEGKIEQFVAHPYLGYLREDGDPNAVPGQDFILGKKPFVTVPAKNEIIVGIFGGSVAEQFSRYGSGALRTILARDSRFANKNVTIFTAAVGGYKQPQQLMALNYYLTLGQHFDVIINIDGFNEIAGPPTANGPKGVNPSFPSGWFHIADRLPDTAMLSMVGAVTNAKERRKGWAQTMLESPYLAHSVTAQFIWKGFDRHLNAGVTRAELALMQAPPSLAKKESKQGLPYLYGDDTKLAADLAGYWERSSLMMHELASAQGIPYLHFLQPNQYVPGSKPFSAEERSIAFNTDSPYRRWVPLAYPLLKESGKRLQAQGVNFRDLSTLFTGVRETVYKDDCCHMNMAGNEMIGAVVAPTILTALPKVPVTSTAMRVK